MSANLVAKDELPRRPQPRVSQPSSVGPPPIRLTREDKRRGVLFAPNALRAMSLGIETMTAPLAATLGPLGRTVVLSSPDGSARRPELLTDAGTIARRVIDLPDRYTNAGAMLIREMVGQMREKVGDGSATAAVLARAMIAGGARMLAAGANPMILRQGMEKAINAAVAALMALAQPLDTQEAIVALVKGTTGDAVLAALVAEIFDIIGVEGTVVVEDYAGTVMDREYTEGIHWYSGLASTKFVTDTERQEAVMIKPLIILADQEITAASQVVPLLELALRLKAESLAIIAPKIDGEALGTLLLNRTKLPVAPIKAAWPMSIRTEVMQDLAVLTGATLIRTETGHTLETVRTEDFGGARRVVTDRLNMTVVGAYGRQKAIRDRIAALKAELDQQSVSSTPDMLRRRLATLSGGVATLKIGAISANERKLKRLQAEDALRCVRAALEEGIVPGGGAAYMACIDAVERLRKCADNEDEAAGMRMVAEALAAPLQQIAENAGYSGATAAAEVRLNGSGFGIDALSGRVVNMAEAGIADPTKVIRMALQMAASTAIMVLTTEAVVLRKRYATLAY